jgi:hypothetical protein
VERIIQRGGSYRIVGKGQWFPGVAIFSNPGDGTVLADTGPLEPSGGPGDYLFGIHGAASVDEVFDVQHRDASNTTTIKFQRRRPKAGDVDFILPNEFTIAKNERLRVVQVGSLTGEIHVGIWAKEVEPGP